MKQLDLLSEYVGTFRESIEPLWSKDMLYEKFTALPDDARSAGFCGPSSVLLFKKLRELYPTNNFSLAVGRVYKDASEFIRGKHVWVVLHDGLRGCVVIDVTADQSRKIDGKVIIKDIDELAKEGINYIPYQLAHTLDDVDDSPKRRAAILEAKLENNFNI